MRKSFLLISALLFIGATGLFATTPSVKSSTAWFNAENFESFTAGTDLKTAGTSPYSDWTGTNVMAGIQQLSANPSTSTASNLIFGFPTGTTLATTFADGGTSGTLNITKSAFTGGTLSGYVYLKTSFYFQTYGCSYSLRNSAGQDVFTFGGRNGTSSAIYCTGLDYTTVALGARGNWADIECVLDLNNKLIKKVTITYIGGSGSPKSWSDIALTNGTDVKSLYLVVSRRSGLDNTTIGQLVADNIQDITASQTNHQTSDGIVNTTLGVTAFSSMMGLALPFTGENSDVDVQWSVSDWGGLSTEDQAKVSVTRGATDYTAATLSTNGAVSVDADITVSAIVAGGATLTKVISLKSASISGVKSTLLSEITNATNTRDAVTAVNPYINGLKSDLTSVINTGQGVYDNAGSTIPDVTTATSNLVSAETAFTNGMATYNAYVAYINSVKAGRDTVGLNYPSAAYFPAIKATLNTAIDAAETAKTTVATANDIASATADLTTAYGVFNTERPAFYTLGSKISAAQSRYNAVLPRKGDTKFLQFPAANVDALKTAIDAANNTLNTGTTDLAMNDETTNMNNALTTFNSASRVAPSANYYRIFSYGVSGGDGSETKKVLFVHKNGNDSLVWASIADSKALALGDSALWQITVGSANNKYIIQNKATGQYLNGTVYSATPVEYSISEVRSQSGYINGFIDWSTKHIPDPNFIYSILNASNYAMEVRTMGFAPYGTLRQIGGAADRYRFAFQFEEAVAPSVATAEGTLKAFACNAGQTDQTTLTVSGDNLFDANISLNITGTNADAFSVSTATISPLNTYLRNNVVTVTYAPVTGGTHTALLSIAAAGGNTLQFDLSGSVITSVVNNNNVSEAIYSANGNICFNAQAGEQVEVFNATGMKILVANAQEGLNTIAVPAKGLFIVKIANRTAKVVL